jgi:hypothetical protein
MKGNQVEQTEIDFDHGTINPTKSADKENPYFCTAESRTRSMMSHTHKWLGHESIVCVSSIKKEINLIDWLIAITSEI